MPSLKYLVIFFLLLLARFSVIAQTADSSTRKSGFKLVFEKAYLHTDRDVYSPGDTLWFKGYLVNAQDNTPANSSNNLHVELISPGAKIVTSEIIRMDIGLGYGDISLPDSLAEGKYRLRAYTNWMRNFGDNFIFEKDITLIGNTDVAVGGPAGKTLSDTKSKTIEPVGTPATPPGPSANNIHFFPEGGSLVEGISSIVAVKSEVGPVNGAILSSTGDTVTHFSTDTLGMGLLAMLPVKAQTYHAVVKGVNYLMPLSLQQGFAMQVRQTDSLVIVKVGFTGDKRPACNIVIKHTGTLILKQTLNPQQNLLKVPVTDLPEGIAAITLYDDQNKPHAERLVYIHHPTGVQTTLTTDKKTYQPKEKVALQISTAANANLSVAVVDAGIVPEQEDNIMSSLMLGSELKGHIVHAARYFDTTNINRFKQLDMLLLTQGWRDFIWHRLADTAIRISYAAERDIDVPGRLRDEVSNRYLPGVKVSMYLPQIKRISAATTDENGKFVMTGISWQGKKSAEFTALSSDDKKVGSFMLDTIVPPVIAALPKPVFKSTATDSVIADGIEKRAATIKASKVNGVTHLKEVKVIARQSMMLKNSSVLTQWAPDQVFEIKPQDEKFKTLEWYLLQNTKGAQKATIDPNTYHLPPTDPNYMRALTGITYMGRDTFKTYIASLTGLTSRYISKSKPLPPQIFINGQELSMDEYAQAESYRYKYFNMPIQKFKKIVLKHMVGTLHGPLPVDMAGRGDAIMIDPVAEIIMVDRYLLYLTLDESMETDNPGSITKEIEGYYEARTFYQPQLSAKPSLNDYRSTIHWEPNVKTDAAGRAIISFYNALPQTNVRVLVQGVTDKGLPVAITTNYTVK